MPNKTEQILIHLSRCVLQHIQYNKKEKTPTSKPILTEFMIVQKNTNIVGFMLVSNN